LAVPFFLLTLQEVLKYHGMKKIILMLVIALITMGAKAQSVVQTEDGKYPVYCTMMAYNAWGIGKIKIQLDLGEVSSGHSFEAIWDENGKPMKFNTAMDAVNYMAKRGWKLEMTTAVQNVVHYIMVKRISKDSEIREGLVAKPE
jgi:hypothetical protein